jgi:2-keto-4-pentenoate hydratase/2-oxohepta-3-ene-1,7-dioic acid hydratase in catechol pathway
VVGEEVVDLTRTIRDTAEAMRLLMGGSDGLAAAVRESNAVPLAAARLHAPVVRPPKFLAVGLNYSDHVAEAGLQTPLVPTIFNKQSTCVVGHRDPIERPRVARELDYEGELAFVIGRRCRHVSRERADEVIAGFLVANDVSVRDRQTATPTITLAKSADTHGPLGPWITSRDEVADPHALRIRTWVNGELRQDSSTSELVFDCRALVAHLSAVFTLEPGDVVATGTPSGVGWFMDPPRFLEAGDVVRVEIEGLGVLENPVVDEPDSAPRID